MSENNPLVHCPMVNVHESGETGEILAVVVLPLLDILPHVHDANISEGSLLVVGQDEVRDLRHPHSRQFFS